MRENIQFIEKFILLCFTLTVHRSANIKQTKIVTNNYLAIISIEKKLIKKFEF